MSKAFTKEDDNAPEAPLAPRLPGGDGPLLLTPEGHRALRDELAERTRAEPPDPARIAWLNAVLDAAEVVAPPEIPERASFGVWVEVEDEDGDRQVWRLVGPVEAEAREGKLSVEAPMGRALLGARVDDSVTVQRPRGALELTICSLASQPPE